MSNQHSIDSEPNGAPAELPDVDASMNDAELAETKAYGRRELYVSLVDMAVDLIYLGLMAFLVAKTLDRWLLTWPVMENDWGRLAAMFLITMAMHYLVSFPISVYSGFVLEHQYKLSHQSFGRWLRRYLLQNLLIVVLGLLLVLGLFGIIWWTGRYWWLVATAASFVVTVLLGQLVPVLILPLFYKIEKLDDDDLMDRFHRLAAGTSLKIEGVYRMNMSAETAKANAMLAGVGRTRRVILGDTLLDDFTPEEIEVVLAHEVGHHVFHHITKLILLGLFLSAASFFVCDRVLVGWAPAQQGAFDYSQTPVFALPAIMFIVTLFSLLLGPLRNFISRRFENACDEYALRVTDDRTAYRSAFTKLAKLNKADPDPHPLDVALFHDHPPIAERLAIAAERE